MAKNTNNYEYFGVQVYTYNEVTFAYLATYVGPRNIWFHLWVAVFAIRNIGIKSNEMCTERKAAE